MAINAPVAKPVFDQETFGFLTLGVGSFFTTEFYHTSLLMVSGATCVQIDLPTPYCRILAEATQAVGLNLQIQDIDHFICTHVHGDHSNGCEDVALYKYFIQGVRPNLFTLPEVSGPLWDKKLAASLGILTDDEGLPTGQTTLETFFQVQHITPETPVRWGDVTMTIRRTRHAVPCFAMIFERGGRRLGYSCDTVFDPELIDWLSPCDLIFHETTSAGPHTPLERLLELDESIKRKMVLIHLSDHFQCDDPHMGVAVQGAFYSV